MSQSVDSSSISGYLNERHSCKRVEILKNMFNSGMKIPISLTQDLLHLGFSVEEQSALIKITDSSNNLAIEHFLTNHLASWHQDLTVTAITQWAEHTDRTLWFRMPVLALNSHVTQRIRYTLLDLAFYCGGRHLISALATVPDITGYSSAFHSLLLRRATQWNFQSDTLYKLAHSGLTESKKNQTDHRLVATALTYLARFHPEDVKKLNSDVQTPEEWRDHFQSTTVTLSRSKNLVSELEKFFNKPPKRDIYKKFSLVWLPLGLRHLLTREHMISAFNLMVDHLDDSSAERQKIDWSWFAGCREDILIEVLIDIDSEEVFLKALSCLQGILPAPTPKAIIENLVQRFRKSEKPAEFITTVNDHHRGELKLSNENHGQESKLYDLVKSDEQAVIQDLAKRDAALTHKFGWQDYEQQFEERSHWAENPLDVDPRKRFFDVAFRDKGHLTPLGTGLWRALTDTWKAPDVVHLDKLASYARRVEPVWQVAYIKTLARYVGEDTGVLKLLDFIRSDDEFEMKAVIDSLAAIDTPRAFQELISCLTRSNTTTTLQLHICNALKGKDVRKVQSELLSAIKDIQSDYQNRYETAEVIEMLTSFIDASEYRNVELEPSATRDIQSVDLDDVLSSKIPHYKSLSSEVHRALRTAQFFDDQVSGADKSAGIDLSPVIDMQYKALELTFREFFEGPCSDLINNGLLQRKLDVLGYARPIPAMMSKFENHLATLPVLDTIPYFSKFKLRKMLRAICQYRPGKRFTLDGLKAFALFFACFSRTQCRFGLQGLFPLPFDSDKELAEFVKMLHVFQDFRNRAAHEGFQPDAQNDIAGIWQSTADIIGIAYRIKNYLKTPLSQERGITQSQAS